MVLRVWRTELRATSRYKYNGGILHKKMPGSPTPALVAQANVAQGDPTQWDQLTVAHCSDQNDVTTLRVRPEAQPLKIALMNFMDIYPLDGKALFTMTTLNTKNFNYVLNTFAPTNSNADEVNPKIMTFIKRYIRNTCEEGETQPNQGPKWWQDVNAYLDPNLRPPLPTADMMAQMEEEGGDTQHKRARSQHEQDEAWASFQLSIVELIEDIGDQNYAMQDINYLMKRSVGYHKTGMLPDDGQDGHGRFRQWQYLKNDISCLNLLKCAKLLRTNEELWEFWHRGLDDREARHLNALLGQEIDKMIILATYYDIDRMELQRHSENHTRYWKLCPSNNEWDGTCDSPHAARCRHLHATLKK